jgi:hypothetical protein
MDLFNAVTQFANDHLTQKDGYEVRTAFGGGYHITYCKAVIGKLIYENDHLHCIKRLDAPMKGWFDTRNQIVIDVAHPASFDKLEKWLDEVVELGPQLIGAK